MRFYSSLGSRGAGKLPEGGMAVPVALQVSTANNPVQASHGQMTLR